MRSLYKILHKMSSTFTRFLCFFILFQFPIPKSTSPLKKEELYKKNRMRIQKRKRKNKMKKNYLFTLLCVSLITFSGCANKTTPCCDTLLKEQPIIHFTFDSANLTTNAKHTLQQLSKKMHKCPHISIDIVGYTDDTGTEKYNMKLGQLRADAVQSYLMGSGVKSNHIHTKSMGENHPAACNSTAEGRQQNRRAVIHFK